MAKYTTLEAELFAVLVELLGDQKIERNALRVLAGARGHELGRPYLHLCQQGLLEETRIRPGFLSRLFGTRETVWVRVTESGHRAVAERAAAVQAEAVPVAEDLPLRQPDPAPPEPPAVATPEALPPQTVEIPPSDQLRKADAVAAPVQPAPPQRPRRFTPSDFTEALGGTPLDAGFQTPASDRLDGLAESLSLLGFELTDAGKLLAVGRWARGGTDAQVALEVVTTALAHAVRLNASGTTKLDPEAAAGLPDRMNDAFHAYVSEGLLDAEHLSVAIRQMATFLARSSETSGVEDYLADPQRGMAPPAVCPDEIYVRTEVEEH